jgi:hypothetical protein
MAPHLRACVFAAALLSGGAVGCGSSFDAIRVVSPDEAPAYAGTKLTPFALIRGDGRAELPAGTRVTAHVVRIPRPGVFEWHLDPGETVETDGTGNVVAIHAAATTVQFVPGTATRSGDEIRGELVDHEEKLPIQEGDRVELRGKLSVGDDLPYGGHVERSVAGGAIAGGLASLILSYAPSAFIAATSSLSNDKWLWVPLAGPWVDLATRPSCVPNEAIAAVSPVDPCLPETLAQVALVADGVLQGLGAILTVVGMPSGAHVEWGDRRSATVRIAPAVGPASGVAVSGTF